MNHVWKKILKIFENFLSDFHQKIFSLKLKNYQVLFCLPSTSVLAYQNLHHEYYQVWLWLSNQPLRRRLKLEINWQQFGINSNSSLICPRKIQVFICNYKKGCRENCICKKVELFCSSVCTNCQGLGSKLNQVQQMKDLMVSMRLLIHLSS